MPDRFGFIVFLSTITLTWGLLHYYVYRRFRRLLGVKGGTALPLLRLAFLLSALSFSAAMLSVRFLPDAVGRVVYYCAAIWMGYFLYLIISTSLLHLGLAIWRRIGKVRAGDEAGKGSVRVKSRLQLATLLLAALVVAGGMWHASGDAVLTRVSIPVAGLPERLEGLRIVHVSDLHIGLAIGEKKVARMVEQINGLEPDLVLIPGDLVDNDSMSLRNVAGALSGIRSRLGVYASAGNHEFYAGVDLAVELSAQAGIRFLRNESVFLPEGIALHGIDDPTTKRFGGAEPDIRGLSQRTSEENVDILIHHRPDGFEDAAAAGIELTVAGHTHAGQIWPFTLVTSLVHKRLYGHFVLGQSHLVVSQGLGTWGPPMRIGTDSEIVVIELVSAQKRR